MHLISRKKIANKHSSVVIKVGTRLMTDTAVIGTIVSQIATLKKNGKNVILVSSGAVGLGIKTLGLNSRPSRLSEIQALASIGQSKLMSLYEKECAKHGFHAAQLLLTASDIMDRERHLNVMNCINSLWKWNILPVINENDSVSVDELKFGDNDCLSALIAVMMKSELTIILTTIDGLHTIENGKLSSRISIVKEISSEIKNMATNTDDKTLSIGGMASKIHAAEIVTSAGSYLWIANGKNTDTLDKIFKGEDIGTIFLPSDNSHMRTKKRWLSFFSRPAGELRVDSGAEKAIIGKGGSLLPSGIKSVTGQFKRGDTVLICSLDGKQIAKGLSNYSSEEMSAIAGAKSANIAKIIGYQNEDEAVHRDNLALIKNN